MFECEAIVKEWGNSLGIVLPKRKILEESISPNQKVRIIVNKTESLKAKEIFGKIKWKTPTTEIKTMLKKELDSKFMR
ncbi:hypothetical protein J4434_07025 [Candidatus Woesearchaeota archaeon]|nr:hypothetical protein [Candidatus Woesearchaeota archaeon]